MRYRDYGSLVSGQTFFLYKTQARVQIMGRWHNSSRESCYYDVIMVNVHGHYAYHYDVAEWWSLLCLCERFSSSDFLLFPFIFLFFCLMLLGVLPIISSLHIPNVILRFILFSISPLFYSRPIFSLRSSCLAIFPNVTPFSILSFPLSVFLCSGGSRIWK